MNISHQINKNYCTATENKFACQTSRNGPHNIPNTKCSFSDTTGNNILFYDWAQRPTEHFNSPNSTERCAVSVWLFQKTPHSDWMSCNGKKNDGASMETDSPFYIFWIHIAFVIGVRICVGEKRE